MAVAPAITWADVRALLYYTVADWCAPVVQPLSEVYGWWLINWDVMRVWVIQFCFSGLFIVLLIAWWGTLTWLVISTLKVIWKGVMRITYRVLSYFRERDFEQKLEQLQWLPEPLIDHIGIHYVIGGVKYYTRPTPLAGVTVAKEMATGRALVARLTQTPPREIRLYSADAMYVGMASAFTAHEFPERIMIATAMHVWKHVVNGYMVVNNGSADKLYPIYADDYWIMLESDEKELDLVVIVVERALKAWIEKSAFVRPLVYADMRRAIDRCSIYSVSGSTWTESYGVVTPHNGLQVRYVIETAAGSSGGPIIAGKHLVGIHVQGRVTSDGPCNFGVYLPMLFKSFRNRLPQQERSNKKRNKNKKAYTKPTKADKSYDDEDEDSLDDYFMDDEARAEKHAYRLKLHRNEEPVALRTVTVNGKVYNSMDDVPPAEYNRWINEPMTSNWADMERAKAPPLPKTPAPDISRKERAGSSQGNGLSREETPGPNPGCEELGDFLMSRIEPAQRKEAPAGPSGLLPEERASVKTWPSSPSSLPDSLCPTGSDQIETSGTKQEGSGVSVNSLSLPKEDVRKSEVSSSIQLSSQKTKTIQKKKSRRRPKPPKESAPESVKECAPMTVKGKSPMRMSSSYLD